jgi:hypothetical protein
MELKPWTFANMTLKKKKNPKSLELVSEGVVT